MYSKIQQDYCTTSQNLFRDIDTQIFYRRPHWKCWIGLKRSVLFNYVKHYWIHVIFYSHAHSFKLILVPLRMAAYPWFTYFFTNWLYIILWVSGFLRDPIINFYKSLQNEDHIIIFINQQSTGPKRGVV